MERNPETTRTQPQDTNNALYMHPSENANSSLVSAVFDGSGYRSWKRGILRALSVKNKTGFINGKIVKPAMNSPTLAQWERCDDMVTSWILSSLSKDLSDSLQFVNNAKELWDELEARYDQANGAQLYQLHQEINDQAQGNLDVTSYYNNIRKLWEELSVLDANVQCTCLCTCDGKNRMHKDEQDRRLIQFLMGLNETYTVVRGNILMMNPLPTMAQTFSILVQEEKQRELKPHSRIHLDSTSLQVNVGNNAVDKQSGAGSSSNYRSQQTTRSGSNNNFRTNYAQRNGGKQNYRSGSSYVTNNRSLLFCDYCKKSGHTEDRCYRIHGFPQDHRFTRGRNSGTAANVLSNVGGAVNDNNRYEHSLTKDQYDKLLNFWGSIQVREDNIQEGIKTQAADILNGQGVASLAGPFTEEPSGDW